MAQLIKDLYDLADVVNQAIYQGDDLQSVKHWATRLAHVWNALCDLECDALVLRAQRKVI